MLKSLRLFKFPVVEFEKTEDVSGKGADGVTRKGLCKANGLDPNNNICISKEYNSSSEKGLEQFSRAVEAICAMRHTKGLEEHVPTVYEIDYKNLKIRSAFLESRTIHSCLKEKNIFDDQHTSFYRNVLGKVEQLYNLLYSLGFIHGDFTVNNLLLETNTLSVKLIDFDDFRDYKKSDSDYMTNYVRNATQDIDKFISSITSAIMDIENKRDPDIDNKKLKNRMYDRLLTISMDTDNRSLFLQVSNTVKFLKLSGVL